MRERERERERRGKEWWKRTCRRRRRLIIQRRVILPIRSNYSRRRIKDRSFSACLFAGDLDTGTRRLVHQVVFANEERFLNGADVGQTEQFTSIRVVSLKQRLQRALFKTKLRPEERGLARRAINARPRPGHAQCRSHG